MSGHRIEDVKAQSSGRPSINCIWRRARRGGTASPAPSRGYKALFVTIDTPVAGNRERDVRNGMKELMGRNWLKKMKYVPTSGASPLAGWLHGRRHEPALSQYRGAGLRSLAGGGCRRRLESAQVSWTTSNGFANSGTARS